MDQPNRVANPARGRLNRKINISLSPFAPENLVSRDGFGRPVPRQPARLNTQAESGAYSRDSSRFPRRFPFYLFIPPYAIGLVPNLSGHAIAHRWRPLPRVRRHRASSPQDSYSNGCCLCRSHHGPTNGRLSFPKPTTIFGMKWIAS